MIPLSSQAQLPRALERLVMPGPVSGAHAQYESECASCHVRFERQSQRQLCLDCHKAIADDLAAGAGFHSKSPDVGGKECATCHTEHEGRAADIVKLDRKKFDHRLTDFALTGKHSAVECDACHAAGKPLHPLAAECVSCHRKDDRHHGNLGETCADCHADTGWKDVRFDHTAKTGYELTGSHAPLACASCHAEERYAETPKTCVGCHREDDKHAGKNGRECRDCHTTGKWTDVKFDHFARSGFALRGGHAGLACESCHEGNKLEVKLPKDCYGCHADVDSHAGSNGRQCDDCHRATQWSDVSFDHARDTKFALRGAHAALDCQTCHVQPAKVVALSQDCASCHADDDPHRGQLGKACASCHGDVEWKTNVRFDHDFARFPLVGKHRAVECNDCHATPAFHDANKECIECHADKDVHEGRFSKDCASCHDPSTWTHWVFDHAKQARFPLDGAHAALGCRSCHRDPLPADGVIRLPQTCGGCHRKDDVHDGEFGERCEQCHGTESFRALRGPR
jgi:hypothetical protein